MPRPVARSRRIAADIERRITAGEWAPGDLLPSRAALGREYGVHEQTIRLAVILLRTRGILESQGERRRLEVAHAPHVRIYDDPDGPWPHGSDTSGVTTVAASDSLAVRLEVNPGVRLHRETQECWDERGRSALLITTWWRGRRTPHADFIADVDTVQLDHDQAQSLRLPVDTVAMRVVRTRLDARGHPVETADVILPRDRWRIHLR